MPKIIENGLYLKK